MHPTLKKVLFIFSILVFTSLLFAMGVIVFVVLAIMFTGILIYNKIKFKRAKKREGVTIIDADYQIIEEPKNDKES